MTWETVSLIGQKVVLCHANTRTRYNKLNLGLMLIAGGNIYTLS